MGREKNVKKIVKRYLTAVSKRIKVQKAILFGSWARGDNLQDSDIDLIVISPDFQGMSFEERLTVLERLWDFEKYGYSIEAFGYTDDEFKKLRKYSLTIQDALQEGIVVHPTSE